MFFEWTLLTVVFVVALFLMVKMLYYKNMNVKESRSNEMLKLTIQEAELVIRKYQIQLQRALGNIDILTDELSKLRGDQKVLKQRNSQHRLEADQLRQKIKDLESRIDALL
ncbi:MAG: membrane protein [Sulfuricurvum sp. PC08-66]|nr:MAG: membrane protein [Sulfuricurvum sp. PC08-66]